MSIWNRFKRIRAPKHAPATPVDPKALYVAGLEVGRGQKDAQFRYGADSPLPPDEREHFNGLDYFPPDPAYQLTLPLHRTPATPLSFQTSSGDERAYQRIGTITFDIEGQDATLAIYESTDGELFLPFRDATSGSESYGAGRYLEPIPLDDGRLLVDFNLAYNPYCAYSPDFSCPLPPIENWLKLPIRAGEKYPHRQL